MALGKETTAREGYYGRMSPPPDGGLYVRDPAAARAEAIREKVAEYKAIGRKIPPHLQMLYDTLTVPVGIDDVGLVNGMTGVETPVAEAEVPVVQGSGTLAAAVGTLAAATSASESEVPVEKPEAEKPEEPEAPKPAVKRTTARKK